MGRKAARSQDELDCPNQRQKANAHDESATQMAIINAASGALAGAIARFVIGPLDVIKIRFQVQIEPIARSSARRSKYVSLGQAIQTIVKEEGIKGLWRGTIPGQLLTIPYTAAQFVTLHQCKRIASEWGMPSGTAAFFSGAFAGAAGTLASYPFDLLRTTMAAQGEPKVYSSMIHAARSITATQGIQGLYRGLGVTLLEIMPYAALQFGLYEAFNNAVDNSLQDMREKKGPKSWTPPAALQPFVCGLLAGTLAKLGTHPLDVVKKRYQIAGLQRSVKYGQRVSLNVASSLLTCVREIAIKEGLAGFYKGTVPSLLKAAPSAAVTLACYDVIFKALITASGYNNGVIASPSMNKTHH